MDGVIQSDQVEMPMKLAIRHLFTRSIPSMVLLLLPWTVS